MTKILGRDEFSFARPIRTHIVDVVVDLDAEGNVLGIEEFLYLARNEPGLRLPSEQETSLTLSIDPEAGAVYFGIDDSRSSDQLPARASVMVADDGTVLAVKLFDYEG